MTSIGAVPGVRTKPRIRRSAADRRAEIVAAATRLSLEEGLDHVTLRSVADQLGVVSSLVTHYFPSVDELLAETFVTAATAELTETFAEAESHPTWVTALQALLDILVAPARDNISTLWVDAWHAGRRRPRLNAAVRQVTESWNGRLADLLAAGVENGEFSAVNPRASAARVMAVVDGLTVATQMRGSADYAAVEQLVFALAETELGLTLGTLG